MRIHVLYAAALKISLGLSLFGCGASPSMDTPVCNTLSYDSGVVLSIGNMASSRSIASADINGDGNADLVTADCGANTISIMLGDGTGTFGNVSAVATGEKPSQITLIDISDDKKIDAVVTCATGIYYMRGNGSGSFAQPTKIPDPVTTAPLEHAFADLDRDGHMDLIVTHDGSSTVSLLNATGPGQFATGQTVSVGSTPSYPVVADFNADGRLDLAMIRTTQSQLAVLFGDSQGKFGTAKNMQINPGAVGIATGDINSDKLLDLIVGDAFGRISIFLGNGKGDFTAGEWTWFNPGAAIGSFILADFDGDQFLDLAGAEHSYSGTYLLFGDGTGKFANKKYIYMGKFLNSLAATDMNGDGKLDLAASASDLNDPSAVSTVYTAVSRCK
ncbi:MAG TPA: VCBS repeat-containing protein [Pseudomonadota bacterium]|nr:VCBS repeat-containing protein [Pseudomonadota bacterium]